jgi:hypothetical protein
MLGHGETRDSDELGAVSALPVRRSSELETSTVRAHSIHISKLSNLHKPGNTSCSSCDFTKDTGKWALEAQGGRMPALQEPRSGMTLDRAFLKAVRVSSEQLGA